MKKLQLWHEYDEMKRQRKEAVQEKEVQRSDRSRRPPERYGKSYSHAAQCLTSQMILEPETFEDVVSSEQKDKWFEAMKTEIESLKN